MSLINDALKKAQKRHAQGQASLPPPTPGGAPARGTGRGQPLPSQLFVLFALGATVLIALSVFATVYLLRRPAAPVVAQAPVPVVKPAPSTSAFPASTPHIAPVVASVPEKPPLPVVIPGAAAAPVATPVMQPPPAIVVAPVPLDPTKPDPKILAYIDAMQVSGVRITGTSRKVLTNDHVYRENDLIDRLLGLRLKKIEEEALTFVDERGVTYTKNF